MMDTETLEAVYDALQLSLPKIIDMLKAASARPEMMLTKRVYSMARI
ncbi:hypothetical protein [Streptococcus equi]|nr:hypothetical protein [Streptococcus equi]MCD3371669.1 hypothetical protein [Streptococcus equi subsp. zooepidemicus]